MTLNLERIMDCVTKQTRITQLEYFAYTYETMIFSVSDYTCVMIPNDQILYLKQEKDELHRKPSTVFSFRVHALFEWQNRSNVPFVFALDALASVLCIN